MSDIASKLKLGKHYSMERFGIMTAMSLTLVFGLVIWGAVNTYRSNKAQDLYQVIYSGGFTTSATGASGSLLGVFEDEERNDAALLMYFPNMKSLSNRAEDYTAEIYGMKDEKNLGMLKTPISKGSCTVYGNTGYVVVTLHSDTPFERELMQVMMGDNNEKIDASLRTGEESVGDLYDLWYVIVNLGGDGVYSTTAFDKDGNFSSSDFFEEIIIAQSENTIRSDLDADIKALSGALDDISTAEQRAKGDGIVVDEFRPEWINGDSVYLDNDGNPMFRTATIAIGGFDFDWRHGSVKQGYLANLAYNAGFNDAEEYLDAQTTSAQPWEYKAPQWALPDGTVIITDEKANVSSSMADLAADVRALNDAYEAYTSLKNKYQIDDLTRLLTLDLDASDRSSVYTENTDNFVMSVQ